MSSAADLEADITELSTLLSQATRPNVKSILQSQLQLLKQAQAAAAPAALPTPEAVERRAAQRPVTHVTNYAWDQTDKLMKIYLTLPEVQKLPKEQVSVDFGEQSLRVVVSDLDGRDHRMTVARLDADIIPAESSFKVRKDLVYITLKKKVERTWPSVELKKDSMQNKAPEVPDDNKDPGAGLMDMMKKMYDEGDDEMKRTIAKAWTESRDGKPGGMPGGMPTIG